MKNSKNSKNKNQNKWRFLVAICFWIGLWWLGSEAAGSSFLLPGPAAVLRALHVLILQAEFYQDVAATFARCAAGILLSTIFGITTAALSYRFKLIRSILEPPVSFLKAVPVMAVIIYGLLLLTSNNVPIMACFLMCYPVVYSNILSGLDYMDNDLLEMASSYEFTTYLKFRYIFLPSLLPSLQSALSLIAGLSWKSVIAAEVLSIPTHSMGYQLQQSKLYLDTDYMFAWVAVIVCLSLVFEKLIRRLVSSFDIKNYTGSFIYKSTCVPAASATASKLQSPAIAIAPGATSLVLPIVPLYTCLRTVNDIRICHLCKAYANIDVLTNYDLFLQAGSFGVLSGPSGRGKTTLLRILSGLEKPDTGSINASTNTESTASGADKLHVAYMFQESRLLPWLNVYDNIAIAIKAGCAHIPGSERPTEQQCHDAITTILEQFLMPDSIYMLPSQLSGGMQRRVSLARALLYPAELLLLDEPFTGLDDETKQHVIDTLPNYTENKTTLLVSHNQEDCHIASHIFSI